MSVICRTFVQNAWRSDLCSNCFKSLEEHSDGRRHNKLQMPRYVPQAPSLYQSRGISTSLKWRLNESLYDRVSRRDIASQTAQSKVPDAARHPGILVKGDDKKYKSRPSVDFAEEEALVIGYGGNDYDSDTSPWEMGSDDGSIDLDLLDDTDEDRKITKLTRNNTEFNSFNKNLLKEEEKLNTINNNNNVNNPVKTNDKAISILTYNDIQSTKTEKKLNQYFFPSSTEIKSFLNGNSLEAKNNNERVKVQNATVALNDDFTPLNTRTYSFVSELSKNNANMEQSSDSDYSTYRHTAGDSTDSESLAEDSRRSPKSSFLHGKYAQQPNELDMDKKFDTGSSTSGDISNFSDDSDTHECADRTPYKPRNTRISVAPAVGESKIVRKEEEQIVQVLRKNEEHKKDSIRSCVAQEKKEECGIQKKSQKDSPKQEDKQQHEEKNNQKEKQSPPSKHVAPVIIATTNDKYNKHQTENKVKVESSSATLSQSASPDSANVSTRNGLKEKEILNLVSKSASMPDIKAPEIVEMKRSPVSKRKEMPKIESPVTQTVSSVTPSGCISSQDHSSEGEDKPEGSEKNLSETVPNDQDSPDRGVKEYDDNSDYDKSPEAINNRQSKLAALALELELARRDSEAKNSKLSISSPAPVPPPEVKVRYSLPTGQSHPTPPPDNYPTIKKASAISCASRLSTLPDVLQETPAKQKKTKFSLKKLLKRNKDSGTFSPASNKEVNPKAWKKQTFDRNRLSLEIVHPMDLTSDVPTSADSTPTEEHKPIVSTHPGKFMFKGVSSRARSLSALPQLSGDDQSGCALLECRKMDTVPARKAGTVAERKKNRPSLVRTPSCSALPNRPSERAPPPKPPPPPKCKAMHPPPPPPPPHSHPRLAKTNSNNSPARPPPPKVPESKSRSHSVGSSSQELHEQNHSDKEYANLGDIRSLLTPKKPERPSAFSAPARDGERAAHHEDIYETLPAEEEDHYTYLDDNQVKAPREAEAKSSETSTPPGGEVTPCGRPWLDLQTSYAAIAAANYESLAELITSTLHEGTEYFKKVEHSLKWKDFVLEKEEPCVVRDKAVYNAVCTNEKVTLVVSPRKPTSPQNARSQTRYPVLASFNDHVPKNLISSDNYVLQDSEMASIYVLQRSKVTTVDNFAKASSVDVANQYIHLRNYCFVLLQMIHTLKSLQAEGIEEINYDLQILALVATDEDRPPVLVLFPEDKTNLCSCDASNRKTLCQATLETMLYFLQVISVDDLQNCIVNGEQLADPVAHTFKAIAKVLSEEKASSLSQAKGFLEYMLWGPVDVKISQTDSEDVLDTILQRWLDLQRAQMVKSTISTLQNRKHLHVYEEYQLIFLLQASVKSLKNVISKL